MEPFRLLRRELRWRYLQEPWTRRVCAIPGCDSEVFQLHHATYGQPRSTELLAVAPLCPPHHRAFEFDVWPAAKTIIPRWLATFDYIVHGEALHEYVEWATPIGSQTHSDQLALWDIGP